MICTGILVWLLVNLPCVYLEDVRHKKLKKLNENKNQTIITNTYKKLNQLKMNPIISLKRTYKTKS